uniref:Uncharacterized protein n=1 Tax=Strigamia maritima TaxID=126957 RepID=T1IRS7_STRMM
MNCSQLCEPTSDKGGHHCACYSGYKLTSDNKTCLAYARIHYVGSIKLKNPSFDPSTSNKSSIHYIQLKKKLETDLNLLLKKEVEEVQNLTILNFLPGGVVEFHFFGNLHDSDVTRQILTESARNGFIGDTKVFSDFIRFESEPALNLQTVYPKEGPISFQGKAVSFACVAKGTSAMRFRWLKDGVAINSHMSNHHIWEGRVPKNTRDEYTAVLMIDKVQTQDSGKHVQESSTYSKLRCTFICEVSDWEEVQRKSFSFFVMTPPTVNLTPLTRTLNENEELTIMCQSEEDIQGLFGYSWLKDGHVLNPSEGYELVEDLYPTGIRMKIIKASVTSVTYTCIVSNRAGQSKELSQVIVIPASYPTCPQETSLNVSWQRTAVNCEDIQPCPNSHRGNTRRSCSMVDHTASWEEPNFSDCTRTEFVNILKRFANLKVGFMATNVTEVLSNVLVLLKRVRLTIYPGEAMGYLDLMEDILNYQTIYPEKNRLLRIRNLQLMFDVMNFLLNSSRALNTLEMVNQLQRKLQMQVRHMADALPNNVSSRTEFRSDFVAEAIKISTDGTHTFISPSNNSIESSSWLTDYMVISTDTKHLALSNLQDSNSSVELAVIFYRNLSSFLPRRYLSKKEDGVSIEFAIDSRLVSISAHKGYLGLANASARISLTFDHRNSPERSNDLNFTGWNVSCGRLVDFVVNYKSPQWILSACNITTANETFTICQCDRFGTYAVLVTNYNVQKEDNFEFGFDLVISICCVVSLISIALAAISVTIFSRKIQRGILMLKFQIFFGFSGSFVSFLIASRSSLDVEWYPFIATALEFFLLLPYSTQVCLELMIYLEITHSYQVQNARAKIVLISWGIPILVTGATMAAQSQSGFDFLIWWIQFGDVYFYGFIITVIILNLLYIALYLIVSAELRHIKMDKSTNGVKSYNCHLLYRCLMVQLFIINLTVSAILHVNIHQKPIRYYFLTSIILAGFFTFLLYGVDFSWVSCSDNKPKEQLEQNELLARTGDLSTLHKANCIEEYILSNSIHDGSVCRKKRKSKDKMKSREVEDLLPDVTANQISKIRADEEEKLRVEEKIEDNVLMGDGYIHLVSYEGSPKKFSQTDKRVSFSPTVMMSQCFDEIKGKQMHLKPDPGKCYIRDTRQHPPPLPPKLSSAKRNSFVHEVPEPIPLLHRLQQNVNYRDAYAVEDKHDDADKVNKNQVQSVVNRLNVTQDE